MISFFIQCQYQREIFFPQSFKLLISDRFSIVFFKCISSFTIFHTKNKRLQLPLFSQMMVEIISSESKI